MSEIFLLIITVINSFVAATLLTKAAIDYLHKKSVMDKPNERSSHTVAVPRGAGLAVIPLVILGTVMNIKLGTFSHDETLFFSALLFSAVVLCSVSWIDDIREGGISAGIRFMTQIASVALPLFILPPDKMIFGGFIPLWADRVVAGFAWVWFINLYNFMDGINGITGTQTISICSGIIMLSLITGIGSGLINMTAAMIIGAAAGFLVWNWGHAKVFLGDVGSVGFGFMCGGFLLLIAADGGLFAAIVIPMYYLADAGITLVKRLLNREKIWEAHRKHFYQAATVQGGISHAAACHYIIAVNVILIVLALFEETAGAWILPPAVIVVLLVLYRFSRIKAKAEKRKA